MLEIGAATLQHLLETGSTLAALDVREHGEYNSSHIAGTSSLPRRLLEQRIQRLVPGKGTQIVVCDDTGVRARLAAATLERLGYRRVAVLDGGLNGWASDNRPTQWGMNVPSKDFGEKIEVQEHVPSIEARELAAWIARGDDLVILDTRTPEEYGRFCIPGGRSVPNGELPYRIGEIVRERPNARVVVNCAGRTRSIIGTRALQRMGLKDVVGLKNGTSGWALAGLTLETGADRLTMPEPSAETRAEAEAYARRIMAEDGVRTLSAEQVAELLAADAAEPGDSVFFIDVRNKAEFEAGHIPGFWWVPGGQVVQRSDDAIGVKNGTIVLACDGIARSGATASWLRQLGYPNVYVLDGGTTAWAASGRALASGTADDPIAGLDAARERVRPISPADLDALLQTPGPPLVLHVGTSHEFAVGGHVPGSHWLPRGWLEPRIERLAPDWTEPIVVTDPTGDDAILAAAALRDIGYHDVAALTGGVGAWRKAGLPLERGLSGVLAPPDDLVPAGPDRSYADMIEYLRWEEALGKKYERA
jgi:rhodanese-related sulfurtransferase